MTRRTLRDREQQAGKGRHASASMEGWQAGGLEAPGSSYVGGEEGFGLAGEGSLLLPILEAEDALMRCLRDTHGVSAPPDVRPTFMALDRQGRGTVNRKQFAHALRQHAALHSLAPHHLRAFMDFFDSSSSADGTGIDYRAFLLFAGQSETTHPHTHMLALSV